CQFLGTAATAQVVGETLGLSLPHSALAPSGQAIWRDMARRSARALARLEADGIRMRDVLTEGAIRNAMAVHAAFGGSTNLLLHLPAVAHAAGLPRPTVEDWIAVNQRCPRLVDVLPNGPQFHPTIRVFLAGGAPEGSVIKSTAIDPSVVDADGVYRKVGPARVFTRERDAVAAIKSPGPERVKAGDVVVLICRGPLGAGMEETYQVTSALKHLPF